MKRRRERRNIEVKMKAEGWKIGSEGKKEKGEKRSE
jgi:hypothetical protein